MGDCASLSNSSISSGTKAGPALCPLPRLRTRLVFVRGVESMKSLMGTGSDIAWPPALGVAPPLEALTFTLWFRGGSSLYSGSSCCP